MNNNKKTCLLSGISGSLGYHFLVHIMKNTNWDVVGIVSFRHRGLCDRLDEFAKSHPEWISRLNLVRHDLIGPFSEMTKKKIGKINYVINLASLSDVEASIHDPVTFIQNNVWSTLNLLEYARGANLEAFVQFSTDETSGPCEDGQRFEEWSPTLPSNPYAASKAAQEGISVGYWRTYNVPIIITNTVNNFSEMQSSKKFPVIIQKKIANNEVVPIHGKNGEIGTRYYIHSRNAADAVLFILKNTTPYLHKPNTVDKPDRYNITSDDCLDNLELAQKIAGFMGKKLKYELIDHHTTRPGHDKIYGLSGEKLKKLGWKPPISFDESLKNVIEWQSQNKEWIK